MRLGVMPGDLPGVILPGVLPRASKSKSGAYCTCAGGHMMMHSSQNGLHADQLSRGGQEALQLGCWSRQRAAVTN